MTGAATTRDYVDQRRIGDATITVISEGLLTLPLDGVFPPPEAAWLREHGEADAGDGLVSGQTVVHVALGDASVIIDPAFDDPGTAWDQQFATRWPGVARTPGMGQALAAIGVSPESVTHVLITHAHDDHFAGVLQERDGRLVPRFPNARHLIGRADWDGNPRRDLPGSDLVTRLGAIDARGLLDPVDGDHTVASGITMIHAPGESPGHAIVRVDSGGATFYAIGDLFHHACEIAHLDWCSPWVEPVTMRASRERFLAEAVLEEATIVFTHDAFPAWGRVARDGDHYRWERI